MSSKKILSCFISASVIWMNTLPFNVSAGDDISIKYIDPLQYTYEIIPLMEPFNEYFYVKTENPNPASFRFSDNDTPYSEESLIFNCDIVYADVEYEDEEVYRIKNGYIFKSFTTNGGKVTLQVREDATITERDGYYTDGNEFVVKGNYKWVDSNVSFTLPSLCGTVDYLINTYANESDFFSNMDAVQEGFSSICLYSGSYIRGKLIKSDDFWSVSAYTHIDQSFYILSPYERQGNGSLLASAIYPFRYDSLGFPSVMASVSKRLSSESSYQWSDSSHADIEVTYNGETKTYGGQGNGKGQGLTEDKITKIFSFDDNEQITLEESKALLDAYAAAEIEDDIPREDALTWGKICDTVGNGAWSRVGGGYSYFYERDDKNRYTADEWGVGNSIYWWGSLGYASDTWVDGRYVGENEVYIPGETFEEHPESDIILSDQTLPFLNYDCEYEYNFEKEYYEKVYSNIEIDEIKTSIRYYYDSNEKVWYADYNSVEATNSSYDEIEEMTEMGLLDEKYLDTLKLTYDEVMALNIDCNTNTIPEKGYIFDGNAEPGTEFKVNLGDVDEDGAVNASDASMVLSEYARIATGKDKQFGAVRSILADVNKDGSTDASDASSILGYYAYSATGGNGTIEEYLNS